MSRLLALLLTTTAVLTLCAQTRKVSIVSTYYADPSMSPKQGFSAAIEHAKTEALAKEFGTILVNTTVSEESVSDRRENSYFSQMSQQEVKGEWIEDLETPKTRITATMPDGTLAIEATVVGRARPISNEASVFEVLPLRNGTEKKFSDQTFYNGDDLYLYFNTPIDGYVAVYFVDETRTVNCLLPYKGDTDGMQPVSHDKEYVFFSENHPYDLSSQIVDQMQMFCDEDEYCQLYVVFSPNPFVKAVDTEMGQLPQNTEFELPRQLSYEDFMRWKGRLATRDRKMGQKLIRIIIRKR